MEEADSGTVLTALLDTLLPGRGEWLPANETRVAAFVTKRASDVPQLAEALDALRALLPADFASRDLAARTAVLLEVEAHTPESFAPIVVEAYRGYYTDARVLALIERKTGYPARPPQPLGRTMRPSDWSMLAARVIDPAPLPTLLDTCGDTP